MKIFIIALTILSIFFSGCGSSPAPETPAQKKARWDQRMQKAQDDIDRQDREAEEARRIANEIMEEYEAKKRRNGR